MAIQLETIRPLLDPKSIAIIGASADFNKIGGRPIKALLDHNYQGEIFPINPKYDSIANLACYPSLSDVPSEIDLGIIILPGSAVHKAAIECGERGVKAIIVMSAGFAEVDESGKAKQDDLLEICEKYGMRMLGPNTVGLFNLWSGVMANFGIAPYLGSVEKGKIGMVSHSGSFSSALFLHASRNNIGLSYFVGIGNQADVDVADCIAYMAESSNTDVILCYFEGINDLNKLEEALKLAKENNKAVLVLKSGRTAAGKELALKHTSSDAGDDSVYQELFNKYGVYRVNSFEEMFDIAKAIVLCGIPSGKNVAVFSISGGANILLADQLIENGVHFGQPDKETQKELLEMVPFANLANPIDMTAQLLNQPEIMREFIKKVLSQGNYDISLVYLANILYNEKTLDQYLSIFKDLKETFPNMPFILSNSAQTEKVFADLGIATYDDIYRMGRVTIALNQFHDNFNTDKIKAHS
ncbi:acyl-CoA synthetase (NDP forming) [Neobacillus niacini]|uniref:acetate--CoA ligase family protein n=1 Tax=Neobacillus niacini TaxID=86668 RepID=UPI002789D9B8|nr:CoA-binding protein [Neobacillus niacini]MDQ1002225.1 acyl-CoA synthetase (NDP forming) [Neobacillus niacini]